MALHNISFKTKFFLVFSILLWASAFVGIRAGLEEFTPGSLALLRYLVASVCMMVAYFCTVKESSISPRDACLLLLVGAIGIGLYNYALNNGERFIPSATAGFITSQSPLITMSLSIVFLRETINRYVVIGVLLSILGVALIAAGEMQHLSWHVGLLYILLATIAGGLYHTLQKPFLKKYPIITATTYVIWGGTLALLVFTPDLQHEFRIASWHAIAIVVYLGIFPAAVGYLAWSYVLARMPASMASNYLYMMPLVTTLFGWAYLNEMPTLVNIAGGLLALVGVWFSISNSPARRQNG